MARGRTKNGSCTVTSVIHATLSFSTPGTGSTLMPLMTRKNPNASGACSIGSSPFHGLISCTWCNCCISACACCRPRSFCARTWAITDSLTRCISGWIAASFIAMSDDPSAVGNITSRTPSAATTILAHHGSPVRTCTPSKRFCTSVDGPIP